jgi:hypothetical protein
METKVIDNKRKFIFIHVPKCGGLSMESMCRDNDILIDIVNGNANKLNEKHNTDVYTNIEDVPDIEFSFSFVRNPFARLVSAWKCPWVTGKKINNKWEVPFNDFTDFIRKHVLKESDWTFFKWSHVMPYTDPRMKLFNSDGKKLLSFIGNLETYQEDFNIVCDKIGIPRQELPHVNKTKHKHYTEYYDDETRQIVAEKYAKDIEYFGYKFGE